MWVTNAARALRTSALRRSSTEFFELYGRAASASAPRADEALTNVTSSAVAPTATAPCTSSTSDERWETFQSLRQSFQAMVYVDPSHVPPDTPRRALASLADVLAASPLRRSARAHTLWEDALLLRSHTPALDLAAAADTATALLLAGKAAVALRTSADLVRNQELRARLGDAATACDGFRFLSALVMSTAAVPRGHLATELLSLVEKAFGSVKRIIAAAEKEDRANLAHAAEVLAWSLDWLWGSQAESAAEDAARLRAALPHWLPFLFATYETGAPTDNVAAATTRHSLAVLPPRYLLHLARRHAEVGDIRALERLLRHAQHTEASTRSYAVFQLPLRMADMLVQRFPHAPASDAAIETYGTALLPASLRAFSASRSALDKTVRVLTSMSGAEPYVVLRGLMRHQPAALAAQTQESAGDVLTGQGQLNWRTALSFTMQQVEHGDPHWRTYLPEALRLLSDAGQLRHFWSLLPEYNAAEATANLSVAASLSQAMQRSGRWWHAMEVLDLVARAQPPRTTAEEGFLAAASCDTLRALLHSRRWQEALHVFALTSDVIPAHETTVVSQLLTSLPAGAPWESALTLAESKSLVSHSTRDLLKCLHAGPDAVTALTGASRSVAMSLLAKQGRFDVLCRLTEHSPQDAAAWRALLQSLERTPTFVSEADATAMLDAAMPPRLTEDLSVFTAAAQLCVQHSWYTLLSTLLHRAETAAHVSDTHGRESNELASRAQEYQHLLALLRGGMRPPLKAIFADPYVVHQLVACVSAKSLAVSAQLPRGVAPTKKQASAFLRVPFENIGTPRHTAGGNGPASVKVYSAAATSFLPEHVLHGSVCGLWCGYKVPGASLFSTARGMLQTLSLPGTYMLAYNMPAASSGIFVLHPATLPLRRYTMRLHLRLCLAMLPQAPPVPLLATTFYQHHQMTWCATSSGTAEWHEVEAAVDAESMRDVRHALRALKTDLNAEGWGLVETEAGAGDTYHIHRVAFAPRLSPSADDTHLGEGAEVVTCGNRTLQPLSASNTEVDVWEMRDA